MYEVGYLLGYAEPTAFHRAKPKTLGVDLHENGPPPPLRGESPQSRFRSTIAAAVGVFVADACFRRARNANVHSPCTVFRVSRTRQTRAAQESRRLVTFVVPKRGLEPRRA